MKNNKHLLILNIDDKKYALPIENVERAVFSVEVTELPDLPASFKGVINYQGEIIPVINIRKISGLPDKNIGLNDIFVIANTSKRKLCIVVDSINHIIDYEEDDTLSTGEISSSIRIIKGLIKNEGNIILIYNLENFISIEEDEKFQELIKNDN